MAVVYVLYSESLDKHYVGSCKDFDVRLQEHQSKENGNSFTSKADDWVVRLLIPELSYDQARKIERHIKSMKSRVYVENMMRYPEMAEKLKRKFYDSGSSR